MLTRRPGALQRACISACARQPSEHPDRRPHQGSIAGGCPHHTPGSLRSARTPSAYSTRTMSALTAPAPAAASAASSTMR